MDAIKHAIDFVLHPDIAQLFQQYGTLIYAILFAIIFVETGLVIMPFLPGDSLLFTAGMLTATHISHETQLQEPALLSLYIVLPLLIFAAILGDNVNYFVGKFFSNTVLKWQIKGKPLVNQEWIDKTHEFFEKYGTKTIIIARFVPIVRTVTPFVSGVGKMNYRTFLPFDILGGILWVGSMVMLGHFLGSYEFVHKHLEKFVLGIVFLSVLPMIIKAIQLRLKK